MSIEKRKNQIQNFFQSESIVAKLNAYFENNEKKIEKFKATMSMLSMEPDFQKWDPNSILACGVQSAQIGLSPQKSLGQVYFVAYKGNLELTIGYKGWQALLERSGKAIKSFPVYKCDEFSFKVQGFEEIVELVSNFEEHKENDVKWVDENLRGVLVSIRDNNTKIIYNKFVQKAKLDQLRGQNQAVKKGKFSPWTNFALEMFMAKAIKYVISKTAMDERTAQAVDIENELEVKQQTQLTKRGSFVAEEIQNEEPLQIEEGVIEHESSELADQDNREQVKTELP